jgi:hypothetical protein
MTNLNLSNNTIFHKNLPVNIILPITISFHGYVALLPIVLSCTKPSKIPHKLNSIGNKIIAYRKEHGLSQRKFAKLTGVDKTTIRYPERNKGI